MARSHRWRLPDIFKYVPAVRDRSGCLLPARTRSSSGSGRERTRCTRRSWPRTVPDSAHFHYVHGATVTPVCLRLGASSTRNGDSSRAGPMPQRRSGQDGAADSQPLVRPRRRDQRLRRVVQPPADLRRAPRSTTRCSDMFYSIWWPKTRGETSDMPPEEVRKQVEKQFLRHRVGGPATSGATRSTSSIRRWPRSTRNRIWRMRKWAHPVLRGPTCRRGRRPHEIDLAELVGARAHRDRHPGMPGRRRRPERRAGRTRRRGAPRGAAQHRTAAACRAGRRREGGALLWCNGGPTDSAPTTTRRSSPIGDSSRRRHQPRAPRAPSCCPNSALRQPISCCAGRHGIGPDGRHRPRRRPAQPRV